MRNSLHRTSKVVKEDCPELWDALVGRKIPLCISDTLEGTICLLPHELAMNGHLLDFENEAKQDRENMLVGEFEHALFHLCNPHFHISQVRIHSLHFYASHRDILQSTIRQLNCHNHAFGASEWLRTLGEVDNIVLLEGFWFWLGGRETAKTILQTGSDTGVRPKSKVRAIISKDVSIFASGRCIDFEVAQKTIMGFKDMYLESGSVVTVYKLDGSMYKAVCLCPSGVLDAMSSEAACASVYYEDVRTDIFHDHGSFIAGWIDKLEAYTKDPSLSFVGERLISDDFHKVIAAIDELRDRILYKAADHESVRLLYAALYYWHNQDKGICRSVCLKVNKILEDVLTERPAVFPPSRVNRSIFRGEHARIRTTTVKPHGVNREKVRARVVWLVNGHRKKPLGMGLDSKASRYDSISFRAELPAGHGWIHYSVQVSHDGGKRWEYEKSDECSNGLLKFIPDERGHRILSFYADTFNLRLDQRMQPLRDHTGAFIYGTFDDISEQLEAIRAEGYTRIYPLGALELG